MKVFQITKKNFKKYSYLWSSRNSHYFEYIVPGIFNRGSVIFYQLDCNVLTKSTIFKLIKGNDYFTFTVYIDPKTTE